MGFLKVLGWIFVPYIMIFVSWKKLQGSGKAFGIIWATIAAIAVLSNMANGGSDQPVAAPTTTKTEAVTDDSLNEKEIANKKAEEEAKKKKEAEAQAVKEAAAKAAEEKAKAKAEEEKLNFGNIGMDVEDFKQAFNTASAEFDASFKINNISVEKGEVQNIFTVVFTDNLGLTGTVNKNDGLIREIIILGTGDGTMESGTDFILAMGVMIAATNPTLAQSARGDILADLGLMDENVDIQNLDNSTIRNGIKYHITSSQEMGFWFITSDANEE
ncbi:hypothetical protein [Paenibacillus sinopodophylli]|uniref:hypothetical protein n=1 Tax=Paenibacillus sinopodophylli TaxID=1837342 RepID=UPI001BB2BE2E|nr:hypothetical protein [Paenibacillus sinopodophylli]